MGRYLTPSPVQSGPVKKQQVFKTSGTFTPSQALLDAGGVVTVRCLGGGGGGASGSGTGYGGASGMDVTRVVRVTGPITVTIGAGSNVDGGTTSFGNLLKAEGGKKGTFTAANVTKEGSAAGYSIQDPIWKGRGGGAGGGISPLMGVYGTAANGLPNTGGGGAATLSHPSGHGGSGLCIVTWEE